MVVYLVPVLPSEHLEHCQQRDDERVEVGVRSSVGEVEGAAEELHSEQSKDENEEKEEEKEGEDGAHGVEERDDEVPQRGPILRHFEDPQKSESSQHG